jgi:hypothetical protein
MSGDTPIYDATCRAVGPPPAPDRTSTEATDGAHHPSPGADDARAGTARSGPAAPPADPWPHAPGADPSTAGLSIPQGDPSSPSLGDR